jgi:DNA-binding response OmpR family regulator
VPRLLLIEDDDAVREVVERVLVTRGYTVLAAASGEDALDLVRTASVDLIVSDVVLPGRDGFQVVAELKRRWPSVKACMMSGHFDPGMVEASGIALDVPMLRKPFPLRVLLETVATLEASGCVLAQVGTDAADHED